MTTLTVIMMLSLLVKVRTIMVWMLFAAIVANNQMSMGEPTRPLQLKVKSKRLNRSGITPYFKLRHVGGWGVLGIKAMD